MGLPIFKMPWHFLQVFLDIPVSECQIIIVNAMAFFASVSGYSSIRMSNNYSKCIQHAIKMTKPIK